MTSVLIELIQLLIEYCMTTTTKNPCRIKFLFSQITLLFREKMKKLNKNKIKNQIRI